MRPSAHTAEIGRAETAAAAPRRRPRLHIPLLLVAAAGCLAAGIALPIMQVSSWIFFSEPFSILTGLTLLLDEGDYLLAAIIGAFSVAFPTAKIVVLLAAWVRLRRRGTAPRWLGALEAIGKWSMLDVFVVALLIFAAKASLFADAQPEPAVAFFTASVVLTYAASRGVRLGASAPTLPQQA
jgi:paraquat-inducible protein A